MKMNERGEETRQLGYIEFPLFYVWNKKPKGWTKHKRNTAVGRIHFVSPGAGQLFYLRLLLAKRLPGSLPDDFQEVFQTTSRKSSRRLPESLLTESSPMSPFHNRSERFGFSDLGLIYMFFRSGSDFGRPMGSLLKYNALEDFQEVFQTTSKKSSRRLPRSLLTGSSCISSGV
ncbi:hypothetical protein F2Q70_00040502 [Brassica cretica]|uniref:Uncharacterized protein n=1 Tax=Brassica cretica TaxID=69181 RepID=A0A8S9KBL1_BRACR|nr:hypothetical protein F2Q70_00040502 [Brassica cretica]